MNRELHIVGFKVGRETYGVPITSLHEIVRVPEITAVPDAPEYMEGVINLRGKIVSVLDLRKRLGETKVVSSRRNRILVVEHKGRLSGLIVDSASEVLKIPATDVEPSPTEFLEGGLNCVTGLGKYQGRLIVLLDMAKLLEFSGRAGPERRRIRAGSLVLRRKHAALRLQSNGGKRPRKLMASPSLQAQLTESEMKLLQALVYQECGMHFDSRRAHFLQDRLQRRLKECQLDSFYSYYRLLISREGKEELTRLLENLTVNETSFFRNKAQLELFHKYILDDMLRRKQEQRDFSLRLWSAGCSTGQEPYTMAMLVADALSYHCLRNPSGYEPPFPKPMIPPPWKAEILASDISYSVLRAGQEGIYSEQPNGLGGLQLSPASFRQGGRPVRGQESAERAGSFRLSQFENGIPAAAQRCHFLPQCDDVFR